MTSNVEPLIAVPIPVRHQIGEIDAGHAFTSSHLTSFVFSRATVIALAIWKMKIRKVRGGSGQIGVLPY
jgi:hypothetical protein